MSSIARIRNSAIAAAEGLADSDDVTVDAELALVRLVAIGDVLRAFTGTYSTTMALPPRLRSWLRACQQPLLADAVAMHTESIPTLATYRSDEALPFSILMRDQTRSIMAALYWRCFATAHSDKLLAAMAALDVATDRYEAALAANGVTREEITTMLGDRATLPE